jgi:cobyrinic acid a,c-diamide synthase
VTPRVVVAGTGSGVGKTTVATGLMAALAARGLRVAGAKVGPDFIDPSYHALATGRPGRTLDPVLSGPELVAPLFAHGAAGADVAVVEGVMGLFDGRSGAGETGSTAHVAKLLDAPVLLVVDAGGMARSVAALVAGFRDFDPALRLAGVILNRVGSDWHEKILRDALAPLGVPVVGALPRRPEVAAPSRHLGLVPVAERPAAARAAVSALAEVVARSVDLDGVMRLARSAPALGAAPWSPASAVGQLAPRDAANWPTSRVAVARGPAFSFHYAENLELLQAAGAELLDLDPLADEALPEGTQALCLGGGFPEEHGAGLAANEPLRDAVRAFCAGGGPVVAECGGLLYLGEELDGHPMCGVLPVRGRMTGRLTLGYRDAVAGADSLLWAAGDRVVGHEFHHSDVQPGAGDPPAWALTARGRTVAEGFAGPTVHASYLHCHWAATPQAAVRLASVAAGAGVPA